MTAFVTAALYCKLVFGTSLTVSAATDLTLSWIDKTYERIWSPLRASSLVVCGALIAANNYETLTTRPTNIKLLVNGVIDSHAFLATALVLLIRLRRS